MNLRQLEIFGAVMATGTTVGAARELNMSQPTVSNSIAHLESQLKVPLFHRRKGRLEPTEEAKILYEHSLKVFEAFDTARFAVERLKDANIGALRIASTPSPGQTLLPIAIRRFSEGRPEVKVSFLVGSLEYVQRSVELGNADLGVFFTRTENPVLSTRKICQVSAVCAVPSGHPLESKKVITPEDMAEHPLISLGAQEPVGLLVENAFLKCSVDYHVDFEVRYLHSARQLVAEGLGLAVVDSFNLLTLDRHPDVVYRPFEPSVIMPAYVAHANNRPLSRLARIFIDDITTCARQVGAAIQKITEQHE